MARHDEVSRPRLRTACNRCVQMKVKCTFLTSSACTRCQRGDMPCTRSPRRPVGRSRKLKAPSKSGPTAKTNGETSKCDTPVPALLQADAGESCGRSDCDHSASSCSVNDDAAAFDTWLCDTQATQPEQLDFGSEVSAMMLDWQHEDAMLQLPSPSSVQPLDPPDEGPTAPVTHNQDGPIRCGCYEAVTATMRRLQDSPGEPKTLDHTLMWNRCGHAVIRSFASCGTAHDISTVLIVYLFTHKMLAASVEAWHLSRNLPSLQMRVGSYTLGDIEQRALERQLMLMNLSKIESAIVGLQDCVRQRDHVYGSGGAWKFAQKFVLQDLQETICRMTLSG